MKGWPPKQTWLAGLLAVASTASICRAQIHPSVDGLLSPQVKKQMEVPNEIKAKKLKEISEKQAEKERDVKNNMPGRANNKPTPPPNVPLNTNEPVYGSKTAQVRQQDALRNENEAAAKKQAAALAAYKNSPAYKAAATAGVDVAALKCEGAICSAAELEAAKAAARKAKETAFQKAAGAAKAAKLGTQRLQKDLERAKKAYNKALLKTQLTAVTIKRLPAQLSDLTMRVNEAALTMQRAADANKKAADQFKTLATLLQSRQIKLVRLAKRQTAERNKEGSANIAWVRARRAERASKQSLKQAYRNKRRGKHRYYDNLARLANYENAQRSGAKKAWDQAMRDIPKAKVVLQAQHSALRIAERDRRIAKRRYRALSQKLERQRRWLSRNRKRSRRLARNVGRTKSRTIKTKKKWAVATHKLNQFKDKMRAWKRKQAEVKLRAEERQAQLYRLRTKLRESKERLSKADAKAKQASIGVDTKKLAAPSKALGELKTVEGVPPRPWWHEREADLSAGDR